VVVVPIERELDELVKVGQRLVLTDRQLPGHPAEADEGSADDINGYV
jgi:hypothetical protein